LDKLNSRTFIDSNSNDKSMIYSSKTIQFLAEVLESMPDASVLDTGAVCNENINFIAQRAKKLFISEMPKYLDKGIYNGEKSTPIWRHLDFSTNSFDVIILWNLIDHLNDNDAKQLSNICHCLWMV